MIHTTRRSVLQGLALTPIVLAAPALALGASTVGGSAFGTYWRVLSTKTGQDRVISQLARDTFAEVDRAMSPFDPNSELSRFNTGDGSGAAPVSADLMTVSTVALNLSRMTAGAFDPTVGPLVGRFGFGPIGGPRDGDWRGLSLVGDCLTKSDPDLTLDLCGAAKGYAIDKLASRLAAAGLSDFLIDLGGELRGIGRHPSGRDWRAVIARPFAPDGPGLAVLALDGRAVATSGVAENGFNIGGRWLNHLIDPATGQPIDTGLLSVTVMAHCAILADGLATSLAVMGPQRGVNFARARRIEALFVIKKPIGEKVVTTGNIARYLVT